MYGGLGVSNMDRSKLSSTKRGFKNVNVALDEETWILFRLAVGRFGARGYSHCVRLMIEHADREFNAQSKQQVGPGRGQIHKDR